MRSERTAGVLLHPSSLPGKYGIGELGDEAYRFVDWLADAGQGVWQVLPLGPTGYGDSPYASFSTHAGNEQLIALDPLVDEGLLAKGDLAPLGRLPREKVAYGDLIPRKAAILDKAAEAFAAGASKARRSAFDEFVADNASWLPDYALFMSIKREYDAKSMAAGRFGDMWSNWWPKDLALGDKAALDAWRQSHGDAIRRVEILQFFFFAQWDALRARAREKGVRIVGDIPIFVAADSVDVWANRGLFLLNDDGSPVDVAGVPPDYFSADGQLWGNPLYDWTAHAATGFRWWIDRIRAALRLYDVVRIDHFRGFEAFWAVPAGEKTARKGEWRKAPGHELFKAIRAEFGEDIPVIAEDLGLITEEVRDLRDRFKLPGMKILQFAFDFKEGGKGLDPRNAFLPHNYPRECVVYTGTHDNDTTRGWLDKAGAEERAFMAEYLGLPSSAGSGEIVDGLVREALKSVADLAVIPAQDLLGLGSEARMNVPSTLGGNWSWRLEPGALDAGLAERLARMTRLYARSKD
ncbi:MAG: 4-alpha-glucanotransferase [Spirochaetales bacterium]|nr:4-alpha-glucanotransferase [Spirochaetales bacterium]